jgi:hypothetical protein
LLEEEVIIDPAHKQYRFVIPAKAGIQQKIIPQSGQTLGFVSLREAYSITWIPAFAGMTCSLFVPNL